MLASIARRISSRVGGRPCAASYAVRHAPSTTPSASSLAAVAVEEMAALALAAVAVAVVVLAAVPAAVVDHAGEVMAAEAVDPDGVDGCASIDALDSCASSIDGIGRSGGGAFSGDGGRRLTLAPAEKALCPTICGASLATLRSRCEGGRGGGSCQ